MTTEGSVVVILGILRNNLRIILIIRCLYKHNLMINFNH